MFGVIGRRGGQLRARPPAFVLSLMCLHPLIQIDSHLRDPRQMLRSPTRRGCPWVHGHCTPHGVQPLLKYGDHEEDPQPLSVTLTPPNKNRMAVVAREEAPTRTGPNFSRPLRGAGHTSPRTTQRDQRAGAHIIPFGRHVSAAYHWHDPFCTRSSVAPSPSPSPALSASPMPSSPSPTPPQPGPSPASPPPSPAGTVPGAVCHMGHATRGRREWVAFVVFAPFWRTSGCGRGVLVCGSGSGPAVA